MRSLFTITKKIKPYNKTIYVDGDKSLSIRWVLLASQATGKSKAYNLLMSEDVIAALDSIKKLGIKVKTYKNYCELKKASDNWNLFPPEAYQLIFALNSHQFITNIKKALKMKNLYPDYGLNGGGFHIMGNKGKLNPHLDYVIHPKLNLMRKFNLIILRQCGFLRATARSS